MKNKNISPIKLLYIIVAILFLQSCEDNLDIPPNDSLIAITAFKNVNDLQNALNTAYYSYSYEYSESIDTRKPIDEPTLVINSVFTDNTKVGKDSGGQKVPFHSLIMDPTTQFVEELWNTRYFMINITTRIIKAVESGAVEFEESDKAKVDDIVGQAYALRAWAHFQLFQYFTPDYLDASGLSVPAVDKVVSVENLPRNTVSEVLSQIDKDLTSSSSLIDDSRNDVKFIGNDFITALRANIALFKGDYNVALSEANKLIAKYPLVEKSKYRDVFLDKDNTEVIFKIARTQADPFPGNIWHFTGGSAFIEMSNSLYNLLDQNDARYEVLLNVSESDPGNNEHKINKYEGASQQFLSDIKIFRVSEMYLIKSEVEIRNNQLADAKSTLQQLRDARFGTSTSLATFTDKDSGLDFLLNERRIELAFEAHRYLDLKRFGKGLNRDSADCDKLENACTMANTDARFTLPIPQKEMIANDLMVQNPGY